MNLVNRLLAPAADRTALITPSGTATFGQLADRAARWRGALDAAGVGSGERLVVVSGNDEIFVLAHLAAVGGGAVVVPLNPSSPPAELARELDTLQPAAAIVGPAGRPSWAGTPESSRPPVLELDRLDRGAPTAPRPVDASAPAAMLYTSGTAGMPKPAVLTHANLDTSLQAIEALPIDLASAGHVVLGIVPLFHILGFNTIVNLALAIGATLVIEDYESPERLADLVATHGVTILAGPPTLWRALAESPAVDPRQLTTLSLALSGAAKLPTSTRVAVSDRLGIDLDEGYGLTETCAVGASTVGTDAPIGSVGRLLPGVEARIVDERDRDVLVGDPGELWLRGPMVSPGYWHSDHASDHASDPDPVRGRGPGGWLRTGDVAVVDDDGNIAIVDRLKDLVIVSGFNVFPAEVEAVLTGHPDVAAAGVVGEPSEETGESLVAYVVARPGSAVDADAVLGHCRQQLARYKVPRRLEVRDALPVGAAGKLRRDDIR